MNYAQQKTEGNRRPQRGFTLIELMIVVAVVGILAMIAYPSYLRQVNKAKRSDAQLALSQIAGLQEKYYSECGYYAKMLTGARGCGPAAGDNAAILGYTSSTSPNGNYSLSLSIGVITASTCTTWSCGFTTIATPTGGVSGTGKLRIDSMGIRQWDKNNNDSYSAKWSD